MQARSTRSQYGFVTQAFHWFSAILVMAAYFLGPGGTERRAFSAGMEATRQLHETLGFLVFIAVLLRIIWRSFDQRTEHDEMAKWMKYSSKFVHLLLYTLLVSIPVTAIVGTWLEGHSLTLLGIDNIGPYLPHTPDMGLTVMDIHTTLGNVILWVAGIHAAAALIHHFLFRDRVLVSMLPRWDLRS
jgi:cytochrome b561